MSKVLLLSEDCLKTYTSLNDNVFGKTILPAIANSQNIELKQVIGSCLLESLCTMVETGEINQRSNENYKLLLDTYIQPYMIYITLSHLVLELSTKLTNFGTVQSNDEHLVNVSLEERDLVKQQYTYYADSYCKQLQNFLKQNKELFPELENCSCGEDGPHLDSAASTGLWLGGYRSPYPRLITRKMCC